MWRIIIISAWASGVVCSAIIGNARASVRGIDNGVVPRFLFVLSLVFKLETKGTDMKMEDNINSRIAFPPVSEENPVIERPWGGEYHTELMLELCPDVFRNGCVLAQIESGYLGIDSEVTTPRDFVRNYCSGLEYVDAFKTISNNYIVMKISDDAVKPDAEYPYLISGYGGGEYYVAIYLLKGRPWNWEVNNGTELKFSGYYCCK